MWARLQPAWRPLLHYADFRGRSTRTEVFVFGFVVTLLNFPFSVARDSDLISYQMEQQGRFLVLMATLCPSVALSVRRLHDQGRSPWWLMVGLPAVIYSVADQWRHATLGWDYFSIDNPLRAPPVFLPAVLSVIALLWLMFMPEQEGPNRYGPDPRWSEPETAT